MCNRMTQFRRGSWIHEECFTVTKEVVLPFHCGLPILLTPKLTEKHGIHFSYL